MSQQARGELHRPRPRASAGCSGAFRTTTPSSGTTYTSSWRNLAARALLRGESRALPLARSARGLHDRRGKRQADAPASAGLGRDPAWPGNPAATDGSRPGHRPWPHRGRASLPLARLAPRSEPTLLVGREREALHPWHGRLQAQRPTPASDGRPGLSCRVQALARPARKGLWRAFLSL